MTVQTAHYRAPLKWNGLLNLLRLDRDMSAGPIALMS